MNDQVILGQINGDFQHSAFVAARDRLIGNPDNRIVNQIAVHSGPKVDDARNELFKIWLTETSADYIYVTDDDMVMPEDTVHRLLSYRKEICGGLYFAASYGGRIRPHLYVIRGDLGPDGVMRPTIQAWYDYPLDTLVEVNGMGGGSMLVTRRAAMAVWEARGKDHPFPWFAFGMHNDTPIGEDIAFCLTAGKLGISSWIDTGLVIGHLKIRPIADMDYVRSLASENHPYYTQRDKVPIYQEILNANSSLDGDRSGDEEVPHS